MFPNGIKIKISIYSMDHHFDYQMTPAATNKIEEPAILIPIPKNRISAVGEIQLNKLIERRLLAGFHWK
jgi:hypothetical protein